MFTEKFGKYVTDGDTISCEVDGFVCKAFTKRDDDNTPPDQRQEGFWPSLDPKDPGYIGPKSKRTLHRERARMRAVLNTWNNDEWDYCGVCVVVYRNGIELTDPYGHALWGVERNYPGSDNEYLHTVANELLPDAIADARERLLKLCNHQHKVVVEVSGGVAEVTHCPPNVEVEIIDHDDLEAELEA